MPHGPDSCGPKIALMKSISGSASTRQKGTSDVQNFFVSRENEIRSTRLAFFVCLRCGCWSGDQAWVFAAVAVILIEQLNRIFDALVDIKNAIDNSAKREQDPLGSQ